MPQRREANSFESKIKVAGLDFTFTNMGSGQAKMDSDRADMGQNSSKKGLQSPCVPGRSGSEAETNENELMKLKLTAKMIRNMDLHWSMWRTG